MRVFLRNIRRLFSRNNRHHVVAVGMALIISGIASAADSLRADYITPEFTYSPNGRYGIMIPIFDIESETVDTRKNKVLELSTQKVIEVINAAPGYDRTLNFTKVTTPRWSADSSTVLWKVHGKWNPRALVLIKIDKNDVSWQLDLLKTGQQAILARTKQARPALYATAKKANAGNGSSYPDGFTVDVYTDNDDSTSVSLPLIVHVYLSSNPKEIPGHPSLNASLDAMVTENGKFIVQQFNIGYRTHWY